MIIIGLDVATTTGATVFADGKYLATSFTAASPYKQKSKQERMAEALGAKVSSLDATLTGAVVDDFERRLWIFFIETIEKHGPISAVAIEKPLVPNHERKKTVIDTSSEWAGKAVRKEIVAGKDRKSTRLKSRY